MENLSSLGQIVRVKREVKNISRETLAKSVGLSRQGVINIENGVSSPTFTNIHKIIKYLEFSNLEILSVFGIEKFE